MNILYYLDPDSGGPDNDSTNRNTTFPNPDYR
jgi:hypothetical protein